MAEYSDKLGAYDEAVVFDDATADRLISAAQTLSSTLTTQGSDRTSWATTASTDFEGHYAEVFDTNSRAGSTDCTNISSALDDLVSEVQALKTAAAAERSRRAQAKEWADRQDHETFLKKGWDWLTSQDQAPPGPDQVPLPQPHEPVTSSWSEPAPAASGSVSSACPQDLRTYATNISGANDTVVTQKGTLDGAISDFATACAWCTIDASGITAALTSFTSNNTSEAAWVNTVADAFEAAGGGDGGISTVSDEAIAACLEAAGVAENRKPLDVASPQIMGDPQTSGYADDPVNTTTGNFVEPEADLVFTGAGASLEFERVYNSVSSSHGSDDAPGAGAFGPGWSSTADERLVVDDEGATWVRATGRHVVFPRAGAGWGRAVGENLWLEALDAADRSDSTAAGARDAGGFVVSDNEGGRWCFDSSGRPAWWSRGAGARVERSYDCAGRLAGLVHERGRGVDVVWDESGSRIAALVARDGRRADFSYDSSGRLVGVTRSGGGARRYEWGEDSGRIERVIDADGVVEVDNAYDEAGRVVRQRSAFGRVSHYSYLPGGVTQVADADGSRANVWVHDARGRLTGMIDAAGNRQSIGWDRWGNRVMITGRDGGRTINQYDGRGRLVAELAPTGVRTTSAWDELDRLVEVHVTPAPSEGEDGDAGAQADPESVVRYGYRGADRNPSTITDPEGAITRLNWEGGLLTRLEDPTGVIVRLSYDEHGELTSITNAVGDTARLERDGAGRVVAAATPLGHRTRFAYDDAGMCVARTDPDGAVWRFEYSASGRLVTRIDPLGERTRIDYGDGGEREAVEDPLGRVLRRDVDDLGNLARVTLPDGSTWDFAHDALSRLTSFTDAAGGAWGLGYDSVGHLRGMVDPAGGERTIRTGPRGQSVGVADPEAAWTTSYDGLGRPEAVGGPDGAATVYRYDRCGRVVRSVDPLGAETSYRYDAAGRLVDVVLPDGSAYSYEYDRCGRWCATVSTGGARYELVYDADGNIVGEIWPTGERVSTTFDECGRPVSRREPGAGVRRLAYDRCGRVVRASDAWYGTRRFSYDAAGQVVAVTNALGGVTRLEWNEVGRLVSVTDPAGGLTRREYDPVGRLTAITDPLGRTTRLTYNETGRVTRRLEPDGRELTWFYDAVGRLSEERSNGRVLTRIHRDPAGRALSVHGGDGDVSLEWDAAGRLVSSRTGTLTTSLSYDEAGRCTSMTGPDGAVTSYAYDEEWNLVGSASDLAGSLSIERDLVGRPVRAHGPDVSAAWTWRDGFVVREEVVREGERSVTVLERDEAGRIVSRTVDGATTSFTYDAAGQLTGVTDPDGVRTCYAYDPAGRLKSESAGGASANYVYDAAGQLLERTDGRGTTRYRYDAAGRRTRQEGPDGERRYSFDARGRLTRVVALHREGDRIAAERVWDIGRDAVGRVSSVGPVAVDWDPAGDTPVRAGRVDAVGAAGVLATRSGADREGGADPTDASSSARRAWTGVSWADWDRRPADPWRPAAGVEAGPDVRLGAGGGLSIEGLNLLGARAYDPVSRSFLSRDPLAAPPGAAWGSNPYSYAGNNPVGMSDPSGLHPLTDAELASWRDSHRTGLAAAGDWLADNWQYVAAAAVVAAGVILCATGVGGPGGAILIGAAVSGVFSAGVQYATTGSIDPRRLARDVAIGGAAGAAGYGVGGWVAGRLGQAAAAAEASGGQAMSAMTRNVLTGVAGGATDGGVSGAASYLTGPGPHTVGGLAAATGIGMGIGGGLGGVGGAAYTRFTSATAKACFTADTPVLMADGTTKPIARVEAGDTVLAHNPDTAEDEPRRVLDTHTHENIPTWRLETSDGGTITTTATHPFWVDGKGWTSARDLEPGDRLHTLQTKNTDHTAGPAPDNPGLEVVSITPTGQTTTVHNLTIQGLHNYHVLTTTGTPALAHNTCTTPNTTETGNPLLYRAPRDGLEEEELLRGLDANRFSRRNGGDGTAYFGTEDVAGLYSDPNNTLYANGFIEYEMDSRFLTEFEGPRNYPFTGPHGEDMNGLEWCIPYEKIDRFNELTLRRTWIPDTRPKLEHGWTLSELGYYDDER